MPLSEPITAANSTTVAVSDPEDGCIVSETNVRSGRLRDKTRANFSLFANALGLAIAGLLTSTGVAAQEVTAGLPAIQAKIAPDAEVSPKLVFQQIIGGADVAAWTSGDRFVVTANATTRAVLVWDPRSGDIVNRIEFPGFDPKAVLQLWTATVDQANVLTLSLNIREPEYSFCTDLTMHIPLARSGDWQVERGEPMGPCMGRGAGDDILPSHDGRRHINIGKVPVTIETADGAILARFDKPEPTMPFAAALSPDGKRLAIIGAMPPPAGASPSARRSRILQFSLESWKLDRSFVIDGLYSSLAWIDAETLFLPGQNDGRQNEPVIDTSVSRIIDAASGMDRVPPIPFRCNSTLLPDGSVIAAALANCTYNGAEGEGIERYDRASGWHSFGRLDLAYNHIEQLVLSPDGRKLAVLSAGYRLIGRSGPVVDADKEGYHYTLRLVDADSGALLAETEVPDPEINPQVSFTPDSEAIGLRIVDGNYRWDLDENPPALLSDTDIPAATLARETANSGGTGWYEQTFDYTNSPISAVRIADGRREARQLFDYVLAEGAMSNSPLRWAVTAQDGFVLWRPNSTDPFADPEILRTYILAGDHFFSLAPDGRYDTDLGADSAEFRWNVSDAPLQSFGPQTFMRNFFEPRLGPRLLDCKWAETCSATLRKIAPIAEINRALPAVRIVDVTQGKQADLAHVEVEMRGGSLPDAPNGKTRSDGYDLRLFRDGMLVAQYPGDVADPGKFDLAQWRNENRIRPGSGGVARMGFEVRLPTIRTIGEGPVEFSAYAFNEDRVKSETARASYDPPAMPARARRVFVIAIGIDGYAEPRLRLNFAAADARLIGSRLANLPDGEEVRPLVLADDGEPGSPKVTGRAVADVFGILGGAPRAPALRRLAAQGIDASMLEAARPDDLVIISYSGHGWTDPEGNFYLAPADTRWRDPTAPPEIASLVSTEQMARALRKIDAGEMALIIDACYSSASIESGGFRAGPMGDAGLGQLAYDKKMRVLAASQADDVALESDILRQGLLSYALADEGLTAGGGQADENGDGEITLDEWLRYAKRRLPTLSADVKLGRLSGGKGRSVVLLEGANTSVKQQEPSLFDFTGNPSRFVLRRVQK